MTFEELGLAQPLLRAVAGQGYTDPTPIQTKAIPHVLARRDLLGCAQTGTGKTAAFALPILQVLTQAPAPPADRGNHRRPIRGLVLSPTRELAAQIGDSFTAYGRHTAIRQTVVFGGVGQAPQVRALQRGVDVLVATPGRLLDLANQGHVDLRNVEVFVLDEADRMLDMGFLPDLRRIIARLPGQRQTLFFSATMPPPIEQLAGAILRDPLRIRVTPVRATTELIEQSVCFVPKPQKLPLLAKLLKTTAVTRALVFTRTKHGADRVARHLARYGIRAEAMHGDKSQSARTRTLAGFRSNRPPVLVATDLAARGIDVDAVSHVFNYDLPHEPETYVHRIGRTGRAGATGTAISLCDHEERGYLRAIQRLTGRALAVDEHDSGEVSPAPSAPPGDASQRATGGQGRGASRQRSRGARGEGQPSHASRRGVFFGRTRHKKKRRASTSWRA
jgi:ATP-dependent RNA helicase RhlE